MVEYTLSLDDVFSSLSDSTRRDILRRVSKEELSVTAIAMPYDLTFAAVSKHLKVLEKAKLIIKRRNGKEQLVHVDPMTLKKVDDYLEFYRKFWENRFDSLETFLKEDKE